MQTPPLRAGEAVPLLPAATGGPAAVLAQALPAGTAVEARVLALLDAGRFLVELGGRTAVAASTVPLKPGQQVRLVSVAADDAGVTLRLADPPAVTASTTSAVQRLAALGLPPTPTALAVLAAFEEIGAPLETRRIQAAMTAADQPHAPADLPRAHARLALAQLPAVPALVHLAQRAVQGGLPNLGAALQELERAARADASEPVDEGASTPLPRTTIPTPAPSAGRPTGAPAEAPAARAIRIQPLLPRAVPTPGGSPTRTDAAPPMPTPTTGRPEAAATPAPTTASVPATTDPPAIRSDPRPPAAGTQEPMSGTPRPAIAAAPPETDVQPQAPSAQRPVSAAPPPGPQRPAPSSQHPVPSSQLPVPSSQLPAPSTQHPAPSTQLPAPGSQHPAPSIQSPAPNPQLPTIGNPPPLSPPQQGLRILAEATTRDPIAPAPPAPEATTSRASTAPSDSRTPSPPLRLPDRPAPLTATTAVRPAATATATPDSAAPTLRLETPDAERQGLAGVLRALVLAGVRPAPMPAAPTATASTATSAPESDRPLAEAPIPSPSRPAASAAPDDDPAPARSLPQTLAASATPAALDAPLARTAREHLAEQVFKPQELADYDRVMPLPLAAADLPTPARLAVASRRGGNGSETHFLRVDAELTRLGPVSLRLSGSDGGPLAITVIAAHRAAGEELAGELPDLVADLRRAGVEAAVRVAIGDADA